MEALPKTVVTAVQESIEDVLNNIRGYAIRFEKGHKENGILVEMVDVSTKEVKARVYADPNQFMTESGMSYLFFEYFGTGTNAEMEHIGTTKHFLESNYSQWFIPVNKVGRTLGYPIITINDSQFYVARGVKANHFLTDAEFKSRNENKDIIINKINEMLKEVCK
jgi:hypothetical protein